VRFTPRRGTWWRKDTRPPWWPRLCLSAVPACTTRRSRGAVRPIVRTTNSGLLVRPRRLRACRRKEWGRVEASRPNEIWQSDMTKVWAGPSVGWAYLVSVIDCCTREIVGWNLSHRCRTEDALNAAEQDVLHRLPAGSREATLTLTTDNGTQFTSSRFLETLSRLGITNRRTAYPSPGGQQLH
jgi:putative transposase